MATRAASVTIGPACLIISTPLFTYRHYGIYENTRCFSRAVAITYTERTRRLFTSMCTGLVSWVCRQISIQLSCGERTAECTLQKVGHHSCSRYYTSAMNIDILSLQLITMSEYTCIHCMYAISEMYRKSLNDLDIVCVL